MRLFVASFLEPACVEQALAFQAANQGDRYKMVPPDKLHLTFAFIGDVSSTRADDLYKDLVRSFSDLDLQDPLEMVFDEVQIWPDHQSPRVIVAVPSNLSDQDTAANQMLKAGEASRAVAAIYGSNQKQDHRLESFKPHITLMRLKTSDRLPPDALKYSESKALDLKHRITKICLVESDIRSADQAKGNYKIVSIIWSSTSQDKA